MKHIAKRRIKNTAQMLAVLGLVGMSAFGMNAYAQDSQLSPTATYRQKDNFSHKSLNKTAIKDAIDKALTNNDYQAYKTAIAQMPHMTNMPVVTEAIFTQMVQAHTLKLAGDTAGAQKIMSSLGFNKMPGMHMDKNSNLTDAQKATLKEAKTLRDAGKKDEAKALLDKAGIKKPIMKKHHKNTQSIDSHTITK